MPVLEMRNENEIESLAASIARIAPEMIELRHYLHQNPELSFEEKNTAAFVAEKLSAMDVDSLRTNIGGHGVIAEIHGATGGPMFALRADMDALPIHELNDRLPYKSRVPGVMHACGHDGHTAVLLGAARFFTENRGQIRGTVRLIFQPAEEVAGGAVRMCNEGAMDGVAAIAALHGWPGMAVGQIGVRPGPMMASSDNFDLTIRGKGAHAAMPHISVDPIIPAAQIILALQTIASREINPADPVVVTVGQIHAGTAYNIIPDEAVIRGTVRCLTNELRQTMAARIERIAAGIAEAHRASSTLNYHYSTAVTYNDAGMNALVAEAGVEVLGAANVINLPHPSMGAEDFAAYGDYAPAAMFRLGVGENVTALHTPTYNFADESIAHGISLFTAIALKYLSRN